MVSKKINELKKQKKLTNQKLSELSGVPIGTLNKITSGVTTDPKLETLKAIAKALDCKLDDFDVMNNNKISQELPQDKQTLLNNYDKLNEMGKDEANKRVEELTYMSKYTNTEQKDECPIDHDIARKYFLYIDKKTNQPVFSIPFFDVLDEIQKNSDMVTEQLIAYGGSGNFLREISREEAEIKKKAIEEALELNNKRNNIL